MNVGIMGSSQSGSMVVHRSFSIIRVHSENPIFAFNRNPFEILKTQIY